jgi:hypothetical protein
MSIATITFHLINMPFFACTLSSFREKEEEEEEAEKKKKRDRKK